MNGKKQFKYYAFISYNHRDIKVARWLHKRLEYYRLPTKKYNEIEASRYLRPIFRDQEDLNTGVLSDELKKHLESSKYLIIICSPNSANSQWVSDEVKAFIEWGRLDYIIPFIIEGTPNNGIEKECFPLSLREYIAKHPDRELLGINIKEVGKEKAFIRVVSKMLDVSFDELWKRHERERRRRLLAWSIGTLIGLLMLYYLAVPVTLTIETRDDQHHLPLPENAVLNVNGAEYPLNNLDTIIQIEDIPGYYRGRELPVSFVATYYDSINQPMKIGIGSKEIYQINLKRDGTFSTFAGTIIDENGNPLNQVEVQIDGMTTQTNAEGWFIIEFPTEKQSESKPIIIRKLGMKDIMREDECPSKELRYIMHFES